MPTRADGDDHALYEAFLELESPEECRDFLADLCTPREIAALQERWLIVRMLDGGNFSYRDISAMTGASTTTIGRVARFLLQESHRGYRRVLDRMKNRKEQQGKKENEKKPYQQKNRAA